MLNRGPSWLGLGPHSKHPPRFTVHPEDQGDTQRGRESSGIKGVPLSPIVGLICILRSSQAPRRRHRGD